MRPFAPQSVEAESKPSSQQLATPAREIEVLATTQRPELTLVPPPTRGQIDRLEAELRERPQLAIDTKHYHVAGLYAREIFIPAGTLLTGKVHKAEHLNVVSQGDIIVWTEHGMKRIKAPFVLPSFPGAKRVGLALTDTTWITIHATDKVDLAELEAELIEPSTPALNEEVKLWLGSQSQ